MLAGYHEIVRLADGTTFDACVAPDREFRIGLYRRGAPLVEFWSEAGTYRRRVGDRVTAYAFRSIEQLRYDFERDAQNAVDRD